MLKQARLVVLTNIHAFFALMISGSMHRRRTLHLVANLNRTQKNKHVWGRKVQSLFCTRTPS